MAHIVDRNDVRMIQTSRGKRFLAELLVDRVVERHLLLQDLDRDKTVQFIIPCFIYIGHAARADLLNDLVAAP